ncbi:MAG TPA: hypothetical protein DEG17_13615 [Cyanobacteria bacterium UBA11149]|nr:hypothetical protein [Cyanobacteria bacterium UBA11367]HBE56372.1 hypothetical protein [Cyanobacteria bacterium UBA11366]HBK66796.1 hypothetical protein [Cyanobacteria bacterium UBA11166]HBR72687.1 hypothetical protein [Cyanobacteria bacterium UBA11159]HBS69152.1 hypothetical protein [Cyanobacteria bacterium UBA11153]HBW89880.1 hypothetical protein [Cyanobacteria bacterium UBA11149]HCA96990.1 hypothetical protein [Cyanobacteria bacterium UBA9226]
MLKFLILKAIRLVAVTLLIAQVTFSPALAVETKSAAEVNNITSEVVDGEKINLSSPATPTEDGKKVTPSSKGEKPDAVSTKRLTYPQPPHLYDMDAIAKFNDELYGQGN